MKIGLVYQPRTAEAVAMARKAEKSLKELGHEPWSSSSWDVVDGAGGRLRGTELLFSLGGDGTLLRSIRAAAPLAIPCMGVNFGKLGFLTEVDAADFEAMLGKFLSGEGWVEERVLLQWRHIRSGKSIAEGVAANDVVVARGAISRVVNIALAIDGAEVVTYTADGVVVTTPTGSTGYALALHGPIMHPQAQTLAIVPICPFMTASNSLVTDCHAQIDLVVGTQHEIGLTADGQTHLPLRNGDRIACTASQYSARFLRFGPRNYFFPVLAEKMRWSIPAEILEPKPNSES